MRYYAVKGLEDGEIKDKYIETNGTHKFNLSKHYKQNPNITEILDVKTISFEELEEARKANMGV